MTAAPLRVANCSGFYGDRLAAARELLDGGPIDVLTGDWLAELTIGVLLKARRRDPETGYARTFLTQLDDVLGDCLDRGIRIVSNAGGLAPAACAREVERIAARHGRSVRVAVVAGDDVTRAVTDRLAAGWPGEHLDTGVPFGSLGSEVAVASAYLGSCGIAAALRDGADVVVTGRVSDAALVAGPARWYFGWADDDWDALAGAVAAGHVIECGAQATGGNFSFVAEIADPVRPGFPIAEIAADGSAVITKHPGSAGAVTVETVTAQLLYEIDGPRYLTPDVVARFDTATLTAAGPDRVLVSGVRGEPPPPSVKVGLVTEPGHRASVTFVLTGDDVPAKAVFAERSLWAAVPGGRKAFDDVAVRLLRADRPDPGSPDEAVALLTVSVAGRDRAAVAGLGRAAVETGLSGYPGLYLTAPPESGSSYPVFWPVLLPAAEVPQLVTLDGVTRTVPGPAPAPRPRPLPEPVVPAGTRGPAGDTERVPLGRLLGARSGDKGGNATLGIWARDDATYDWLAGWLTESRWRALLPQAAALELRPWWLPGLRAAGVTVVGLLGHGVAANLDLDSQAKGLGEFLRARRVDLPAALLHRS
ncbi:DUF1446 domain-containing protein [Pseudonocardia kongjuensis]|uniref:DUF1446 domain-containing protein n=1 Tax=Pseudonocardia kongjuensis TaxID=102227 RepID=A0ABP4IAG5_9PSEU